MKALSVKQPWAEMIACGLKTLEIRGWKTGYRGPLLICSSKEVSDDGLVIYNTEYQRRRGIPGAVQLRPAHELLLGFAVCVVDLTGMVNGEEVHDGHWRSAWVEIKPSNWAWVLERPVRVKPVPIVGRLGLFEADANLNLDGHL